MDFGVWFPRWIFWWIFAAHFLGKTSRKKSTEKSTKKSTIFRETFWPKSTQGNFCLDIFWSRKWHFTDFLFRGSVEGRGGYNTTTDPRRKFTMHFQQPSELWICNQDSECPSCSSNNIHGACERRREHYVTGPPRLKNKLPQKRMHAYIYIYMAITSISAPKQGHNFQFFPSFIVTMTQKKNPTLGVGFLSRFNVLSSFSSLPFLALFLHLSLCFLTFGSLKVAHRMRL